MDYETLFLKLIACLVMAMGVRTLLKGSFTIGGEGSDDFNRTVSGARARWLGVGYVGAGGCMLLVNTTIGIVLLVALAVLAWMLGSDDWVVSRRMMAVPCWPAQDQPRAGARPTAAARTRAAAARSDD